MMLFLSTQFCSFNDIMLVLVFSVYEQLSHIFEPSLIVSVVEHSQNWFRSIYRTSKTGSASWTCGKKITDTEVVKESCVYCKAQNKGVRKLSLNSRPLQGVRAMVLTD